MSSVYFLSDKYFLFLLDVQSSCEKWWSGSPKDGLAQDKQSWQTSHSSYLSAEPN
jgi:hypothetical protein